MEAVNSENGCGDALFSLKKPLVLHYLKAFAESKNGLIGGMRLSYLPADVLTGDPPQN